MAYEAQLRDMQLFTAENLHRTNEFKEIEIGYEFNKAGANIFGGLNELSDRIIYAVKRPEFLTTDAEHAEFIVLCHADKITARELGTAINIATEMGVPAVHLLYKFTNNDGPFYRRRLLEEEKVDGALYHKSPAYRKQSLKHYSKKKLDSILRLRDMEKDWFLNASGGAIFYYEPKSPRRKEALMRVRFSKPVAHYMSYPSKELERHRFPFREYYDRFSLVRIPYTSGEESRRLGLRTAIRKKTSRTGKQKTTPEPVVLKNPLTGEFLKLPDVDAANDDEIKARKIIGLLKKAHEHGLMVRTVELLDEIPMILDSLGPESSQALVEIGYETVKWVGKSEQFRSRLDPIEGKDYGDRIMHFYFPSKTRQGLEHKTTVTEDKKGELEVICNCKGYTYLSKCWHIREAAQKYRSEVEK